MITGHKTTLDYIIKRLEQGALILNDDKFIPEYVLLQDSLYKTRRNRRPIPILIVSYLCKHGLISEINDTDFYMFTKGAELRIAKLNLTRILEGRDATFTLTTPGEI